MGFSFRGHQTLVPHWGGGGIAAPVADFEADVVTGDAPVTVTFTNLTTGDGTITYSWDFGDGSALSTDENPTHEYTAAGTYTVTLTADNGLPDTETKTDYITIYETITLQPDTTGGLDTEILSAAATTPGSTGTLMRAGEFNSLSNYVARALIKFDLTTLPANAIISSTVLSLFAGQGLSSNGRTFRVSPVNVAWTADATWNTYDGSNNWPGGAGGGSDIGAEIGNRAFTDAETLSQFKDFTLTPTTKAGLGANGWMLKADTEADDAYGFRTFNHTTANQRPKLVIRYTLPGA